MDLKKSTKSKYASSLEWLKCLKVSPSQEQQKIIDTLRRRSVHSQLNLLSAVVVNRRALQLDTHLLSNRLRTLSLRRNNQQPDITFMELEMLQMKLEKQNNNKSELLLFLLTLHLEHHFRNGLGLAKWGTPGSTDKIWNWLCETDGHFTFEKNIGKGVGKFGHRRSHTDIKLSQQAAQAIRRWRKHSPGVFVCRKPIKSNGYSKLFRKLTTRFFRKGFTPAEVNRVKAYHS